MQNICSLNKHLGCDRQVYKNSHFPDTDMCIFHCEHKDPQEFRNALARQILAWRRARVFSWDFRYWWFTDVVRTNRASGEFLNLFLNAVFPIAADFYGAKFKVGATFKGARFHVGSNFQGVHFYSDADFSCVFFNSVDFEAVFDKVAEFTGAHFRSTASFDRSVFNWPLFLDKAKLDQGASFVGSVFNNDYVSLFSAEIKAELNFEDIVIKRQVSMTGPSEGKVLFKNIVSKPDISDSETHTYPESWPVVKLADTWSNQEAKVTFDKVDMRHVVLNGLGSDSMELSDTVEWPTVHGCVAAGDAVANIGVYQLQKWLMIESTYRSLEAYYLNQGNRELASQFHRRLARSTAWVRFWKSENPMIGTVHIVRHFTRDWGKQFIDRVKRLLPIGT